MSTIGPLADSGEHECQNCGWQGGAHELKGIEDLTERIDPGGTVPSGECPKCGALAYPVVPTQRYLFVMQGGIEPGDVIGPVRDDAHQEELILQELRDNSELLNMDGEDTIHVVEIPEHRAPEFYSFSGGYMDDLRGRVEAERGGAHDE